MNLADAEDWARHWAARPNHPYAKEAQALQLLLNELDNLRLEITRQHTVIVEAARQAALINQTWNELDQAINK